MSDTLEVNAAICYECLTLIVSQSRHDFRSCKCENGIFVDGGLDYQRFGWGHDNYSTFTKLADLTHARVELTQLILKARRDESSSQAGS